MSCSSVNILGIGDGTVVTPAGPPLFIANLDPIRKECYTNQQTSVIYLKKYIGDTAVERAPVALGLQNLPGPNPESCGLNNLTILELLKSPSGYVATNAKTVGGISNSALVALSLPTLLPLSSSTQPVVEHSCLFWTGQPQVPTPPNPSASPNPLWAVLSSQRACY